jgi:cell division protein FtsB
VKQSKETPAAARRKPARPARFARAKRTGWLVGSFVALVFIVNALVGDRGLLAMMQARREYDELSDAIARQRTENARLREEIRRLQEDPSAIEELARRELGLIRPGERVFIVKDLKTPPTP